MTLPDADTEVKASSEAADTFVGNYYQALNSLSAIAPFYVNSSTRYSVKADLSINGKVLAAPDEYKAMLDAQGPNVLYEVESIDAHVINPSFSHDAPEHIHDEARVEKSGGLASIVVTIMGKIQFGKARDSLQQPFNETLVLVPNWDVMTRNPPRAAKRWLIMSQNFRALRALTILNYYQQQTSLPPFVMPAKAKGSTKAGVSDSQTTQPTIRPKTTASTPNETVEQRSQRRRLLTNPLEQRVRDAGLSSLSPAEKKTYAHSQLVLPVTENRIPLTSKAEREFWKVVNKDGLAARRLRLRYGWGQDRTGRDVGSYTVAEFEKRSLGQAKLTALDILHRAFLDRRARGRVDDEDVENEKARRLAMAALKRELYGEIVGSLAQDPEWDDVVPIPQSEPEDALAKIAYADDYAEVVSYLRAVMAANEHSPRCLRLTERVISMNPAHYTVWLYRFQLVCSMYLHIPDEITWLNQLALENLKNYQIWHHRQLLVEHYFPLIAGDDEAVRALGSSETSFIATMLAQDSKNYHVWSYRQYLVEKLGLWTATELASTQSFVETDVRNNSAWSHRFFLVFSDPAASTPESPATAYDAKVPASVIDREIAYAQDKILLAPQNQSGWLYLRGVLVKGSRDLESVAAFAERFVGDLGQANESVRSSHALDLLADVYKRRGDLPKARLCLQRLWEKWDPVREGYWKHRASQLEAP
ncbi:hypothetical protein L249_7677 [Ophiocordyceps polyrhachis-furcata BCC 54312]|uniref:Protein farnesyltransferase/geranylgeranyltransferase type-1 subunit alpha n=1 Tax=Ophiocordyceps polyrhachis-furcata BCC 54312 TaxID=1330021 RepID=A0A367LBE9_9HYPO|nr:hypothetical protein L249_7677 [Ophiocordyceps polyrhachis-furcata BCC 54312]